MKRNAMPRRILAMFLSVMMMVGCLATTASALSLEDNEDDDQYYQDAGYGLQLEESEDDVTWVEVYVDDVKVKNVDVFIDDDGEVYLSSSKDVKRIFPEETKDLFFSVEEEATL